MSRAIFLGTFDPPHKGHYNAVKTIINSGIMNKFGIDKIHVIPAGQNPNKTESTAYKHRYKMCQLMFKDLVLANKVVIDDIESQMDITYTTTLIEYFHSNNDEYIKDDFWWIITVETLEEIVNQRWFNSDYLLKNNKFLVLVLPTDDQNYVNTLIKSCKYAQCIKNTNANYFEFHSSDIRKLYREGFDKALDDTNPEVKEYIIEHNLYWS